MRRNKWVCALKTVLAELEIFGPKGNPNPAPSTTRVTQIPWEHVQAQDEEEADKKAQQHVAFTIPSSGWKLRDNNNTAGESCEVEKYL